MFLVVPLAFLPVQPERLHPSPNCRFGMKRPPESLQHPSKSLKLTIDVKGSLAWRNPIDEASTLPSAEIRRVLFHDDILRAYCGVHLDTSAVLAMCSELTWNLESAETTIPRDDKALRTHQVSDEKANRGVVASQLLPLWSPLVPKYISDQTAYELEKMTRTIVSRLRWHHTEWTTRERAAATPVESCFCF